MGQNQFMPSSFARFAVDHDGDGRRDIWTTRGDVFASTANYLAGSGWRADLTWGRKVRLPKGFDTALAGARNQRPLSAWQRLGVRRPDGSDLPDRDVAAALVLPEKGARSPAYLVYDNFEAILRWNRSDYFAIAVGYLADAIGNR
jgi:membrane-bound lytic murein transglycosylase B